MVVKIKSYSLEAVTALLLLSLIYTAARAEVLDVINASSKNQVVATTPER